MMDWFFSKKKYRNSLWFQCDEDMTTNDNESNLTEGHIRQVTSMELPHDWENVYDFDDEAHRTHVDSIGDGLIKCLNRFACVDIEYISSITGKDCKSVINKLKGSIYQNPDTWNECFYKGWETAEEYLSGNIREKLKAAEENNRIYHGYFDDNVKALKKIIPPTLSCDEIYVTLGSPWVPEKYLNEFADVMTGNSVYYYRFEVDKVSGAWKLTRRYKYDTYYRSMDNNYRVNEKYGVGRLTPIHVMLKTMNMQSIVIYDSVKGADGVNHRVINQKETIIAQEKQEKMIAEFRKWIWSDPSRSWKLESIYAEKYLNNKVRHFDGSFLGLPGLNPEIILYQYQKNAVARIIFTSNTLLAHDVGSGKTYIMIVAGMELRRLKLSAKNMYVVPNNIVGQWREIFALLYPEANVLFVEPGMFTPKRIDVSLKSMRDGDYDAIIIAYSCFTRIKISREERIKEIERKIVKYSEYDSKYAQTVIKKLKRKKAEVQREKPINEICFDHIGITRLFVDEIHNFKNVPIESNIENVMGISKRGSDKCADMLEKVRIVQRQNSGSGVVLATGTPITNSITDIFVIQQYLQSAALELLDIGHFDQWVAMFAQKSTNFEIDVDTSKYRLTTRFSKFHNIPELTNILAAVADFHQIDATSDIPITDGYEDVLIRRTKAFSTYLEHISTRADLVRSHQVSRKEDNMLLITTDGRKAALDMRLVRPNTDFSVESKVFRCAENISRIYKETISTSSAQLIFCDASVPKQSFNIYDELKGLLIKMGVKDYEIAYVHDATTERKRQELFENVRNGTVRVLIGSTFKLGLGVNVQDRLIALHHLDIPWRPADMVQREGRILRQGNSNHRVHIFRYITEGSFDAYSWQLLETKQRFITAILSGTIKDRSGSDVDDTVLSYAEVKALAVGNPMIKKRIEISNELTRLVILQQNKITKYEGYRKDIPKLAEDMRIRREMMVLLAADADYYERNKKKYSSEERKKVSEKILEALDVDVPREHEVFIAEYQGFRLTVPQKASKFFRTVYLSRAGEYKCKVSYNPAGIMQSIDNVLNDLCDRLLSHKGLLESAKEKKEYMQSELAGADIDYTVQIEKYRKKLEEIDSKLSKENELKGDMKRW